MLIREAVDAIRKVKKGERKPDRVDIETLASLVGRREYKKALRHYEHLDTFVREIIPSDVVHFIRTKVDGGVRTVVAHVRLKDCKKVFKEGFRPGVVYQIEMDFPKGIKDDQLALALVQQNSEILAKVVEVLYTEGNKELCAIDTGRGW